MNERDFAYWLNGFAELTGEAPTAEQWKSIREHLATVFVKVTQPVQLGQLLGQPNSQPFPQTITWAPAFAMPQRPSDIVTVC